MQDLIVIIANCPLKEQIDELEDCVNHALQTGYHVALISHTHVPLNIQQKCNYYIFDFLNEISHDYELNPFHCTYFGDNVIYSRFFQKYFYGFAIYRMQSLGANLAKIFGYTKIHQIEYDCILKNKNILSKHSTLLDENDAVFYTDDGTSEGFLFGSLQSFKTQKLPNSFLIYNKNEISNFIKNSEIKFLEYYTKNLFSNSKVIYQNKNDILSQDFQFGKVFHARKNYFTIYYDNKNEHVCFFYKSFGEEVEITVLVNDNSIINLSVKKYHWYIFPLITLSSCQKIRVFDTEKLLHEFVFDEKFSSSFKNNSYIE